MKKLKLNKLFQPCVVEVGDELYPNGIFVFNITKLQNFIENNKSLFLVENFDINKIHRYGPSRLHKKAIKNTNLSLPIILAEISPGSFNVIDGHHRVEKALHKGYKTIPAYRIMAEQHIAFLTTKTGYREYVKYWNEKVKRL
jgi:hypothetical protein